MATKTITILSVKDKEQMKITVIKQRSSYK